MYAIRSYYAKDTVANLFGSLTVLVADAAGAHQRDAEARQILEQPLGAQVAGVPARAIVHTDEAVDAGGDGKVTAGARFERRSVDYGDSSGLDLGPAETMGGGEIAYIV